MKKNILIVLISFLTSGVFAQNSDTLLNNEISIIKTKVSNNNKTIKKLNQLNLDLKNTITDLEEKIETQNNQIKELKSSSELNSTNITSLSEDLGTKIQTSESNTTKKISDLDSTVGQNRLYWIIGSLVILILGAMMYIFLGKRIKTSKTDVESQIKNTKNALEEESVKLDSKLMEVLDTQLKLKDFDQSAKPESEEKDHSLVLKVADEVTRILMNLEVMDKNIKGYKHLKKYSASILDNLKAYGYEIPQLIGQNYNSGMNMVATLEFDDTIEEGKQIIKRIIKPQINYNNKVIQTAKVIVAYNE